MVGQVIRIHLETIVTRVEGDQKTEDEINSQN